LGELYIDIYDDSGIIVIVGQISWESDTQGWWGALKIISLSFKDELGIEHIIDYRGSWMKTTLKFMLLSRIRSKRMWFL